MKRLLAFLPCLPLFACMSSAALTVKDTAATPADFPLVAGKHAATILVDAADAEVVRIAAEMLAEDVGRVTDVKPLVTTNTENATGSLPLVVIGTLGKSALIDGLVKRDKLDIRAIEGKWESFIIRIVADPFPGSGVKTALVIAGSDRRGAAYGALTISETIGVSPWVWWADVTPRRRANLALSGSETQGPPSVKYRGIFLNDEGDGLYPWAIKTFDPEAGGIGPKTYAKVCELLLRLKANYLWPAMQSKTSAFNTFPENKLIADRHAIVMGSAHCEQMLRNNVAEWPRDRQNLWNPVTNLPGIVDYWEQRVRENGPFENIYTVGMRGIHDGEMPGGGTLDEKRDRLEKIIALQRGLLARHVNPDPAQTPQIFCAYKEVLEIYQAGLKLPGDITLLWPDDNYGYIRQLSNADERKRPGGSGIYYHISYCGRPHDYLWLDSTAPALIWHEMTKAYELGAREVWIVNVGDLKSNETGMTLFLEMARDIRRHGPGVQKEFLLDFYRQQFGEKFAAPIAALRDEYYRLCAIRKPEHMGFNNKKNQRAVQNSGWPPEVVRQILERWQTLAKNTAALAAELPAEQRDAYFQLVEYPACAAAAHAGKLLLAESARLTGSADPAKQVEAAYQRVQQLTKQYNTLGNGKWNHMMDAHQGGWHRVFKMPPLKASAETPNAAPVPEPPDALNIDPAQFIRTETRNGAGWCVVEGLGPRGHALAMLPHRDTPTLNSPREIRAQAPFAEYAIALPHIGGEVQITLEVLPTHRLTPAHEVLAAVSIDDTDPVIVRFDQGKDDENDPIWQRNVLRSMMTGSVNLKAPPSGARTLKLWAAAPGVVVQRISIK